MKKLMVLALSFGLVLLGTAPVMAAGQAAKAAPPTQQEQVVQVVVPEGEVLRTPQLLETSGQQWQQVAARGVQAIYRAGRAALNFTKKHPCITGCVVGHYLSKHVLDPVDRAASKAWDASKGLQLGPQGKLLSVLERCSGTRQGIACWIQHYGFIQGK